MPGSEHFDVVVVGGGYAGMQAALTLGRACRKVLIIDSGTPRNARAAHVHNFLGQQDPAPADLLATAQSALREHAVDWQHDVVEHAEQLETSDSSPLWRLDGRHNSWTARAVVIATGLHDELPDVPGVEELWGREVVACPHCHGWEVRGAKLAQLGLRGAPARGVERAVLLSRWSRDVTLFTDGDDLSDDRHARLAAAGVKVETGRVSRIAKHEDGQPAIEVEDGSVYCHKAVFAVVMQIPQTDAGSLFGCTMADTTAVATDVTGRTDTPGIWAAGTAAVPHLLAIGAAGHASTVAVHLNNALIEQDLSDRRPATIPTCAS